MNAACPMCGRAVDSKAGTVPVTVGEGPEARHYSLAFCSPTCSAMFKRDTTERLGESSRLQPGPKTNYKK